MVLGSTDSAAIKAFSEVLQRDPEHLEAACQRGDVFRKHNDFERAIALAPAKAAAPRGARPRHEGEPELPNRRGPLAPVKRYDAPFVNCYTLRLMDGESPRQAQRHVGATQ